MKLAAVIALVLATTGCNRSGDSELDTAKAQVQRFFSAVTQSDCPTLEALLPATRERGGCDKLLHEIREDLHLELVDISDARRDGRDRSAIIVRTTVLRRGQQQTMLVRVTHEQGVWQLVL